MKDTTSDTLAAPKTALKKRALLAAANVLARPPALVTVSHEQILAQLLAQVGKVDFYALAALENPEEKLKQRHYVVLVVEHLLTLADRNNWGLCRRDGFVYTYNGAYWRQLEADELQRFLMQAAEQMGLMKLDARSHGIGKQLHEQFLTSAYLPTPAPNRAVIRVNLQNGTFDISPLLQRLRQPDRADFLTHQLPFAYDETAAAPTWQAFLNRVVPDESSQRVLAEYLAYVFVHPSQLKLEKVLLLHGSGANGKSVFFEVVTALLGAENVSNYSLNSLTTEPAYCRANLATVLVNYASELSRGLEADAFKQLVSGEPIEARLPYGKPFTIRDYAKLIFNCNELPTDVEHTHAYFRRFLIVPFSVTIPEHEQDKTLAARIIADELAGVFNWVLEGLKRLIAQQNFTECEAARQEIEEYKRQSDSVRLFLDENGYTPSPTAWLPTLSVFQEYRRFCIEDGYRAVSRKNFMIRLRAAGIEESRRNTGRGLHMNRPL